MSLSKFCDHRGYLCSIKAGDFFPEEVLISHSHANVLRGLHMSPYRKNVFVMSGAVTDFWYHPESGEHFEKVLRQGESTSVPANAMHGFFALEETTLIYFLEHKFIPAGDKTFHWSSPCLPFRFDFDRTNMIISSKDDDALFFGHVDYVILGNTGFLGSFTEKVLAAQNKSFIGCSIRLSDTAQLERFILKNGAKYVICAAGISGRPTTQWCEDHEKETFDVNYLQLLNLASLTERINVHLTIYGSALLHDPVKSPGILTEEAAPTLTSLVYVRLRAEFESHMHLFNHVLYLRIIYPVSGDGHPKCFLSKMKLRVSNVHDVQVPLTVLPDLFPKIPGLIESRRNGILNFVNAGTIGLPKLLSSFGISCVSQPSLSGGVELSTAKLAEFCGASINDVGCAIEILNSNI